MLETRDLTKIYDNTILAVNKLNVKSTPGKSMWFWVLTVQAKAPPSPCS